MGNSHRGAVEEASLQIIRAFRPLLAGLRQRDSAVAEQLVRALNNVAMSSAKLEFAEPRARRALVLSAIASASEVSALLQMAVDWRYCPWPNVKPAWDALATTVELLWKLARPKRKRSRRLRRAS
jgi:hypothetical protein